MNPLINLRIKPRIKKYKEMFVCSDGPPQSPRFIFIWGCFGRGTVGSGFTPKDAYSNWSWKIELQKQEAN